MGDYHRPGVEKYNFQIAFLKKLAELAPQVYADLYERLKPTLLELAAADNGAEAIAARTHETIRDWAADHNIAAEWVFREVCCLVENWLEYERDHQIMRADTLRETYAGHLIEGVPAPLIWPHFATRANSAPRFQVVARGWNPEEETWAAARERLEQECREAVDRERERGLSTAVRECMEKSPVKRELDLHCAWVVRNRVLGDSKKKIAATSCAGHKTVSDGIADLEKHLGFTPPEKTAGG